MPLPAPAVRLTTRSAPEIFREFEPSQALPSPSHSVFGGRQEFLEGERLAIARHVCSLVVDRPGDPLDIGHRGGRDAPRRLGSDSHHNQRG